MKNRELQVPAAPIQIVHSLDTRCRILQNKVFRLPCTPIKPYSYCRFSTALLFFLSLKACLMPLRFSAKLLCLLFLNASVMAGDWPQWRGPLRNAQSDEKLSSHDWNAKPPQHLWTVEGFGAGYASLSIVDGVLYTVGNTEQGQSVIAAKASDGSILWKSPVTEANPKHSYEGSRCTPTVAGDHLYVVTSDGSIACLARGDGSIVWQRKFSDWNGKMMSGWGFSESPLVDGDRVLCTPGGSDALVVCLDRMTGKDIWTCAATFEGSA